MIFLSFEDKNKKSSIVQAVLDPVYLCVIVCPLSFILVFCVFLLLQENRNDKVYEEYMNKPLESKVEYIDLKRFSGRKNGSERISNIANRYSEAGYQVTIKGDSMLVEKNNK